MSSSPFTDAPDALATLNGGCYTKMRRLGVNSDPGPHKPREVECFTCLMMRTK